MQGQALHTQATSGRSLRFLISSALPSSRQNSESHIAFQRATGGCHLDEAAGSPSRNLGKKDTTVHPDLERLFAKRMGATTYEPDSSHVPMLSQPERVLEIIRTTAKAVQGAEAAA